MVFTCCSLLVPPWTPRRGMARRLLQSCPKNIKKKALPLRPSAVVVWIPALGLLIVLAVLGRQVRLWSPEYGRPQEAFVPPRASPT